LGELLYLINGKHLFLIKFVKWLKRIHEITECDPFDAFLRPGLWLYGRKSSGFHLRKKDND